MRAPTVEMRVSMLLDRHPSETLTCDQVAERVGCTKRSAQNVLMELKREGKAFTRRDFSYPGFMFVWGRVSV